MSSVLMAGIHFHLLVATLLFSQLLCLQAVPVTRTENLLLGTLGHLVGENNLKVTPKGNWEEQSIMERMDLELNDYPGSGANNRHTPRASAIQHTTQG